MPFINPYNFARPTSRPMPGDDMSRRGRDRLTGRSGVLHCRLVNETPLFLPSGTSTGSVKHFFLREDRRFALPGTSLKGALRSITEAIAGGCSPFGNGRNDGVFGRCQATNNLCPCCRLFGFLPQGSRAVHKGLVGISDAVLENNVRPAVRPVHLDRMGQPKPSHTAFYRDAGNQPRGRKLYWHQPRVTEITQIPRRKDTPVTYGVSIHPMPVGAEFAFTVRYSGLNDEELGLLLWTLLPGEDRRHKVGYGKGLGLGTVRITATAWEDVPDAAARYQSFDFPGASAPDADVDSRINRVKQEFTRSRAAAQPAGAAAGEDDLFSLPDPALQDLNALLTPQAFPEDVPIHYPSESWFRNNSQELLPTAAETVRGIYLPD